MTDDHDEHQDDDDLDDDGGRDEWIQSIRPYLPADYDDLNPLEQLRAQHQARELARRQEWLAEHGDDPIDPFTQADIEGIIGTIDEEIHGISRADGDESWLKLTYCPRPPVKLIDITMGDRGNDEPTASLMITDTEAYDLIDRIIAAIGPRHPGPPLEPRADLETAEETDEPCPRCGYVPGDDLDLP